MGEEQPQLRVLLVEDNPGDARLVEHHLEAARLEDMVGNVVVHHEDTLEGAMEALDSSQFDIVFLDLGLPESRGLETLDRVIETNPEAPIVVLTGLDDREVAVEAIQRGAQDYLPKDDLDADRLSRSFRYAIERYRKEIALRRQNERLDDFARVVSHDLRNPLNVAQGRVDLAAAECETVHLEAAANALERMQALTDDLLVLAREGDTVTAVEAVPLASLVRTCWEHVDTEAATLVVETERTIAADASRLKQLFENLFRNAVQHGGDSVRITVGDLETGFFVADDGPGIPPEKREQVFEGGYSTEEQGTGFGLQIVEQIASAHDWGVEVTESSAGGAEFCITGVEPMAAVE